MTAREELHKLVRRLKRPELCEIEPIVDRIVEEATKEENAMLRHELKASRARERQSQLFLGHLRGTPSNPDELRVLGAGAIGRGGRPIRQAMQRLAA